MSILKRSKQRPIWVTGGAGMIGSALVGKLIERGERVIVMDNFSRGNPAFVHPQAELVGLDLSSPIPTELMDAYDSPKAIYHLACRVGGVNYMLTDQILSHRNAAVDWNVFDAALRCRIPLLYCSTACVYPVSLQTEEKNGVKGSWLSEEMATENGSEPESIYGWAKLLGELTVAAYAKENPGCGWKIVRMFNAYGPREIPSQKTGHVIPALIHKILCGQPPLEVWGRGTALRAFTYVDDCADGIISTMEGGTEGVPYNIGTSELIEIGDLAQMILHSVGITSPLSRIRFDPSMPEGVFGRGAICRRAKIDLGWKPKISLKEGIALTLAWCKKWLIDSGEWDGTISDAWFTEPFLAESQTSLSKQSA